MGLVHNKHKGEEGRWYGSEEIKRFGVRSFLNIKTSKSEIYNHFSSKLEVLCILEKSLFRKAVKINYYSRSI